MKNDLRFLKKAAIFAAAFLLVFPAPGVYGQGSGRVRVVGSETKEKELKPDPAPVPGSRSGPRFSRIASYLRRHVNRVLANPLLKRGRVGIRIDWLDRKTPVFSHNADKYFIPASNMKSYTVAAAIDSLTPDYRFITSVYADAKPDSSGVVRGNLIIYGRGDPSFSTGFSGGDYYRGIDLLADRIARAGVKRVEGSLIGDETYFNTEPIPHGWEWDDLQWYYGAEISSLSINNNAVDLKIMPGADGSKCIVSVLPRTRLYRIINTCQTTPERTRREIRVKKKLNENVVEVSGNMPENDRGYSGAVTVSRPAGMFVEILRQRLSLKGIKVTGAARAINLDERDGIRLQTENYVEITAHKSPPLGVIAAKTMKPSQNLYTELILRALGEERGDRNDTKKTSARKGIAVIRKMLSRAGAQPESVIQYDGSGLSRHNIITPNSAVRLFSYIDQGSSKLVWRNALTVGGVDGTLKNRFRGTSAEGNVRGKTGTLNQVSTLSGYVTSISGERFVFSILTNNLPDSRLRTRTIDDIVLLLSDFDSTEAPK